MHTHIFTLAHMHTHWKNEAGNQSWSRRLRSILPLYYLLNFPLQHGKESQADDRQRENTYEVRLTSELPRWNYTMQVSVMSKDEKREHTLILNSSSCIESDGWYGYITTSIATAVLIRMKNSLLWRLYGLAVCTLTPYRHNGDEWLCGQTQRKIFTESEHQQ